MPVIGSTDRNRIYFFRFENLSVVFELCGARADLLRCEIHIGLIDVADRRDGTVLVGEKRVEHLVAAVSERDEPNANAVIRAMDVRVTERAGHTCCYGGL